MKTKFSKHIGDLCRTILILSIAVLVCIIMQQADANSTNATMIMVLAVLLVARFTDGYLWGILTSIVTVIAVNYLFTYPYYHFNLTISGYLLTFVVNLSISLIVSVMNTRIKQQETMRISAERERLRTDLFRAVSHDLRTPLTSIVGSTGVILENDLDAAKQRELISDVNTDAQWLLRMVENLLAVTRVSNSAQPLKMQPEIVEDVVAEAVIKFSKRFEGFEFAMKIQQAF